MKFKFFQLLHGSKIFALSIFLSLSVFIAKGQYVQITNTGFPTDPLGSYAEVSKIVVRGKACPYIYTGFPAKGVYRLPVCDINNGTTSWSAWNTGLPASTHVQEMIVSSGGYIYIVTELGELWYRHVNATTWQKDLWISGIGITTIHAVKNTIYLACGGGAGSSPQIFRETAADSPNSAWEDVFTSPAMPLFPINSMNSKFVGGHYDLYLCFEVNSNAVSGFYTRGIGVDGSTGGTALNNNYFPGPCRKVGFLYDNTGKLQIYGIRAQLACSPDHEPLEILQRSYPGPGTWSLLVTNISCEYGISDITQHPDENKVFFSYGDLYDEEATKPKDDCWIWKFDPLNPLVPQQTNDYADIPVPFPNPWEYSMKDLYTHGDYLFMGTANHGVWFTDDSPSERNQSANAGENMVQEVSIYPSNTSNLFYVSQNTSEEIRIQLYDLNGKLLIEQFVMGEETAINISSFAPGIYIVRYEINDHLFSTKIVKQ
ncbi:MAG: T9SS type A sorting domain-containing protein [Chitinophagales bacterium]|nr:T9SS type A sorting domain-containing protein [Chitinophagales bacterium]